VLHRGKPVMRKEDRDIPDIRCRRVLVIDDNATNRRILRDTLFAFGCQPELAPGGREGLALLKLAQKNERPFDMVLLDVQMPEMSGLEVLKEIRRGLHLSSLPVILLTSVDTLRSVTNREELGWSAYLTKPVKQSMLLDAMRASLCAEHGERTAAAEAPPEMPSKPEEARPKPRILLAEDNQINRRLAETLLDRAGYAVTTAENGLLALDLLKEQEFDLVLMDVQMPEMDGFEATRIIRENPRWEHLPVVAMTAYAMKGDRERCLEAGMTDYISKPLRKDELLEVITRYIPQPSG